MANNENQVVFGLKNVHYAIYDPKTNEYASPVKMPGAVSLAINREGQVDDFYADDGVFASWETNGGYSGTLTIAHMSKADLKALCGYKVMNGILIEDPDAATVRFALLYEVSSNTKKERFVFYDCVMSRPESSANTRTDTTDPDTQAMDIKMSAHEFSNECRTPKGVAIEDDDETGAKYLAWYSAVQLPVEVNPGVQQS